MKLKSTYLLALVLSAAGGASALVRPEAGTALPDYDVRSTFKGLALGATPGKLRAKMGRTAEPVLSARQQDLLRQLRGDEAGSFVVRYDDLTGSPRLLFRYDAPLTPPDGRDPGLIARDFAIAYADLFGFDAAAAGAFLEGRRFTTADGSLTLIHLEQAVSGVEVFHGHLRFAITPRGEIAQISSGSTIGEAAGLGVVPSLDAAEAVRMAGDAVGVVLPQALARINPVSERVAVFEKGPYMTSPTAEPVLFPMGRSARLGYKVYLPLEDRPASYEVVVDAADGTLLFRANLVNYAQTEALVFPQDPGKAANIPVRVQYFDNTVLTDPRWPLGWADADRSIGNVADAKEDWAGDNEATIGRRAADRIPGAPYFFEDPWTNSYESTGNAKADANFAITNLFYFANKYHDWLYGYGFDEASGNWQRDNFNRGGKDADPILVDAQDSYDRGQRNNANMGTGPDGQSPRAQFFLFTAGFFAQRDSDVDGDVVFHEFTHGLSHRLIGGANTASCLNTFQSGSMGEGWADWYACAYYDDPVMGEYATGNAFSGIRSDPYDAYPACHLYTAAAFCSQQICAGTYPSGCEVHDEGQLWAAVLWELRMLLLIADPANGADIALRLVTDGMKLTACNPSFLDARDGILLADRYDYAGVHQCLIWEAFAGRSMGFSATTTSGDDTAPNGASDLPPFCNSQGKVLLNLTSYGCGDSLIVTVQDRDPSGSVPVRISSSSGDVVNATASGVAPIFTTGPIPVVVGAPAPGATLEVQPGDIITAEYTDASPAAVSTMTAPVNCLANVTSELRATGGCAPDAAAWPTTIPEILDAGETVDFHLVLYNREPRPLTNVRVSWLGISDPRVAPVGATVVNIPSIAAFTGTGTATFTLGASKLLTPGTVDLNFLVEADGFTGTASAIRHTIPVMSNYQIVTGTTGVQDFEASDGGYIHYPWPYAAPTDEWRYPGCAAASGTKAWGAANPSCAGNAAEQDANLETALINPVGPTRVAWYPTELRFNHRMNLGTSGSAQDAVVIAVSEPNLFTGGDYGSYALLQATQSTGASFAPVSITLTAADSAGLETERGLVFWFDFYTLASSAISTEWIVDDVETRFSAADAVAQAGAPTCVQAGYVGTVSGTCATGGTFMLYNTLRPAEMQFAGNGRFWNASPDWTAFDVEFPTPSLAGENLVFLSSMNANDGAHAGQMTVDGQRLTTPVYHNFGNANCTGIPTPNGPPTVAAGQPIVISWSPFTEAGPVASIVGYRVYRLDAETYPAATSTINDYLTQGVLVGSTVGAGDINRIVDTAPAVVTGLQDDYTYAIVPLLRCDGASCAGPVTLTFGGSETLPGTPNFSTDSNVVTVSRGLLAQFDSYAAVRQGGSVVVSWSTLAEIDTLGFDVYRGSTSDPVAMVKVNRAMVTSRGTNGASYVYTDAGAPAGPLYYQVREIAASGTPSVTDVFAVSPAGSSGRGGRSRGRGGNSAAGDPAGRTLREGRSR